MPVTLLRFITICVLVFGTSAAAAADENSAPSEAARAAIEATISAQIEAFRRDDGETAFSFAAPAIRARFGDANTFMKMVRSGYQPVYRPQLVEFLTLAPIGGRLIQRVLVVGPDDALYIVLYEMRRQADDSWRINAVALVPAADEAT
ncbi:MAG: DUF4864 domain-containing protein [Alphaproteobacteria bacterium]|nr:DUF4864 domain-containing protein [Alphaproteobacteria bacterium]